MDKHRRPPMVKLPHRPWTSMVATWLSGYAMTLHWMPPRDWIRKHIRDNTNPQHVRAKILKVDDIPCTISGKISEVAVRETIHDRRVKKFRRPDQSKEPKRYADLAELGPSLG